jgi:hypothetical protein
MAAHVLPEHITVWQAVLLGLIATPIAPVAKDVASAVTAAVQAVQTWNG